ncbi:MAG: TlpA family protein disulfide reductase [Pyrinomonadaceae bacterium]|nr:TlpA family protein disulfide reductase [Pyrinomonadaceae bacterium]
MRKLILPLLLMNGLVAASALNAASQSGRRVTSPRPTQTAPIQPPVNPEPEPQPAVAPLKLLFLPESLRERQIKTLNSGSFRLVDFQGKVVVINLWASWCGPCRREVPEYEKVRKAYAGRDVEFIGLTTEDPRTASDQVNKFARDLNFGFRLGWADRETARTLMNGRNAIPQTLVLDANGRVVSHWSGYSPGRGGDRLRQAIDHALESAP